VTVDRRRAALAVPVAVPLSMAAAFGLLRRLLPPRTAHLMGFTVYWSGWCLGFPLWALGPRGVTRALTGGRRATAAETVVLAVPVVGAVTTQLLPHRREVTPAVAAVMVGAATVNAVGEELLWRGVFLTLFPGDVVRGALWPLAGFSLWHLAPQVVLPATLGRGRFVLGAALVGATSTFAAWRTGGLRAGLLPHTLTDACGVRPARFWLGRGAPAPVDRRHRPR
jgi:hypothetical protein